MDTWQTALLLARFVFYIGTIGSIGGLLILIIAPDLKKSQQFGVIHLSLRKYILLSAVFGFLGSAIGFFTLVGSFSATGIIGMFDLSMIELMLDSNSGKEVQYRCIVFLLIGIFVTLLFRNHNASLKSYRLLVWTLLSIALSSTFFISGHLFEAKLLQKITLMLHVLLVSFWIGTLYPLIVICKMEDLQIIKSIMNRYSQIAFLFVPLLIFFGGVLAYYLISSKEAILFSMYGRGILLKAFFVILLLLVAARHKWFLVPKLNDLNTLNKLRVSIGVECAIGFTVLAITAVLTSVIGIDSTGGSH